MTCSQPNLNRFYVEPYILPSEFARQNLIQKFLSELFPHIFPFLPIADLYTCCQVSKTWRWNATYNIGCCYLLGKGVVKNTQRAAQLFIRASMKGHVLALYKLAELYEEGSVQQHTKCASLLYMRASSQGHLPSLYKLALLHKSNGYDNITLKLFKKAVSQRPIEAAIKWADLYQKRYSVPLHSPPISDLFCLAEARGDPAAMHHLGEIYARGEFVARDLHKAELLFSQAIELGYVDTVFDPISKKSEAHNFQVKLNEAAPYLEAVKKRTIDPVYMKKYPQYISAAIDEFYDWDEEPANLLLQAISRVAPPDILEGTLHIVLKLTAPSCRLQTLKQLALIFICYIDFNPHDRELRLKIFFSQFKNKEIRSASLQYMQNILDTMILLHQNTEPYPPIDSSIPSFTAVAKYICEYRAYLALKASHPLVVQAKKTLTLEPQLWPL